MSESGTYIWMSTNTNLCATTLCRYCCCWFFSVPSEKRIEKKKRSVYHSVKANRHHHQRIIAPCNLQNKREKTTMKLNKRKLKRQSWTVEWLQTWTLEMLFYCYLVLEAPFVGPNDAPSVSFLCLLLSFIFWSMLAYSCRIYHTTCIYNSNICLSLACWTQCSGSMDLLFSV